jgi:hypothetical protein
MNVSISMDASNSSDKKAAAVTPETSNSKDDSISMTHDRPPTAGMQATAGIKAATGLPTEYGR